MLKHAVAAICAAWVLPAAAQELAPADIRVEVVTADRQPLSMDVQLSGQIEAVDTLELGFHQGGRVSQVLVEQGDQVKPGQPLARLDAVQQDQALNVAEAGLAAARAGVEQARQARDRAAALLERGVGTRAAADQAEQALSQAEGALERAEAAVEQTGRALEDAVLRAPAEAVVTTRSVAPGQVVGAAQPVLTLAETNGLEAVFLAPDDPLLREIQGREIRLMTLDIDRPDMTAVVTEVSPLVDPETGTVTIRARVRMDQAIAGLLGASVRGHLQVALDDGVVIPWNALMRKGDGAAVWTVGPDLRVSLTPIVIAAFVDGAIYVAEGLSDGQQVVGEGAQLLYPGRRVQPVQEDRP